MGGVMRFVYCFLAALLLASGMGGVASAGTPDQDPRLAVLGRQKIREELSAALAKGYLTRMDQYHLLVHAKEVLSTEDLRGFERTLDRLASEQAIKNGAALSATEQRYKLATTTRPKSSRPLATKS